MDDEDDEFLEVWDDGDHHVRLIYLAIEIASPNEVQSHAFCYQRGKIRDLYR